LDVKDTERLLALFDRADLAEFWSADGRSEVEIWPPASKSASRTYRIDRLVLGVRENLILDYKSGNPPSKQLAADHPYVVQLARYCEALKSIEAKKPVRAALLWLETGRLDWLSDDLLSQSLDGAAIPNSNGAS
jgi:ATP-dependent exoDNAse (exonuclease V) beta subunit